MSRPTLTPKDIRRAAKYRALQSLLAYAESLESIHEEPLKSAFAFEAARMKAHAERILTTDSWVDYAFEPKPKSPKEQKMAHVLKEIYGVAERAIDDRWEDIKNWEPLSKEEALEELQRVFKYGFPPTSQPPADWSAWAGSCIALLSFLLACLRVPEESK